MNYIVLDLEWNQAAYKIDEEEAIPFEIIEIGAVKLDKNCKILGERSILIRPQVYPFLVRRTKELTGITDEMLDEQGIYFEDAIKDFLEWCGRDYIFCVWGGTDLTQLERNMAYYEIKIPWKYPFKYLDAQKLYALEHKEGKTRRTLEYAVEQMNLPTERPFHRAVDDAFYTAEVFQRIDRANFESFFSIDYFKVPRNWLEETTFRFGTYSKFVSRSFPLKEEAAANRKVREIACIFCRRKLQKELPWFSDGGRSYLALGYCREHGMMRARIRIKNTEDHNGYFAVRTVKACTPEDEAVIRAKRDNVRKKRKEHRKREKQTDDEQ